MYRRSQAHLPSPGFTLIELLIAIAIIALLSALAWPSLQEAVQRSRRADAMSALSVIQQAQERWRANNPGYQSALADLPGGQATTSPDGHYTLSIVEDSTSRTSYAARATVRTSSPQSSDSRCQWLQVTINAGNVVYSSSGSDGVNAAPDPCWVR